jgi:creatinine amidohydrolase/Fe(II)-dependent formamide hydrolase-like protein
MMGKLNGRWGQIVWALLLAASVADAHEPSTVLLEDMTWTEVRDAIRAGTTTIIIPIGGTEQSGRDVALGKHNARVIALSKRIAEGLHDALVAPVVAYVPEGSYAPPTSHMRFPGTMTVPEAAFDATLISIANSAKVHGFTDVIFLGDHGGYQPALKRIVAHLNKDWADSPACAFAPSAYYETATVEYTRILLQHGVKPSDIGTHAGLADTSLLLAVAPYMVRTDRLRTGTTQGPADGVYSGDPRYASAELGQLGAEAIVSRTIDAIKNQTTHRQGRRNHSGALP